MFKTLFWYVLKFCERFDFFFDQSEAGDRWFLNGKVLQKLKKARPLIKFIWGSVVPKRKGLEIGGPQTERLRTGGPQTEHSP